MTSEINGHVLQRHLLIAQVILKRV